jgi:hypothetical protein
LPEGRPERRRALRRTKRRSPTRQAVGEDWRADGGARFFSQTIWSLKQATRLSLVDRFDADLSIVAQCRLLKVARSTLYHRSVPLSADDLRLMRWLDQQYLTTPFYGSRRMVAVLRRDGEAVNRKRVRRLMRLIGIETIYMWPSWSALFASFSRRDGGLGEHLSRMRRAVLDKLRWHPTVT